MRLKSTCLALKPLMSTQIPQLNLKQKLKKKLMILRLRYSMIPQRLIVTLILVPRKTLPMMSLKGIPERYAGVFSTLARGIKMRSGQKKKRSESGKN